MMRPIIFITSIFISRSGSCFPRAKEKKKFLDVAGGSGQFSFVFVCFHLFSFVFVRFRSSSSAFVRADGAKVGCSSVGWPGRDMGKRQKRTLFAKPTKKNQKHTVFGPSVVC